ncbi:MAG: HAD family phosphatase [Clostridia bacterium]|nr:HAD family phosphatase [Clostridia bacterium]
MNLKGILFDFNGTLLFDSDMHMEAFRRVLPKYYGIEAPSLDDMLATVFGRTNRMFYTSRISPDYTEDDLKTFVERKENEYFNICMELGESFRLADGAYEMLDAIKESGIPYCLATGSERINVEFYMKHLNLDRWFSWDNIVYENGTFVGKPAPDIYHLAAERLGLSTSDCLVFEDGTSGIRAANAAGAGAVIAVYDKKYPSPLTEETKVDAVYHDHLEWKKTLAKYGLMR